jgi:IclR family transcriptional regulator, acetate operon repressor
MSGSLLRRAFGLIEQLSLTPDVDALANLADTIDMPKSGCHRLLAELIELGYVAQDPNTQRYRLTSKVSRLGFRHLSSSGVTDVAQPILDRLAQRSRELVRLGVIDGNQQVWVAKAQGARQGLRFDPEMGGLVPLAHTASGHAWLMELSDEDALRLVVLQGMAQSNEAGPRAPRTIDAVRGELAKGRRRGYAYAEDWSAAGTAAIAVAIRSRRTGAVLGTVSIAGPSVRMQPSTAKELSAALRDAAAELADALPGSPFLQTALATPPPLPAKDGRTRTAR